MIRFASAFRVFRASHPRGAVLVSVLGIMVFLMILFLGAMTFCLSRYQEHVKVQNRRGADFLAAAGVCRVLAGLSDSAMLSGNSVYSAPNGGTISAQVLAWGPYLLVLTEGAQDNQHIKRSALIGARSSSLFDAAVTVTNTSYPFVLAGATQILGDINTGPLGVTTGRIEGEGVVGENYHLGNSNVLGSLAVPALDTAVVRRYYRECSDRKLGITDRFQGSQLWTAGLDKILKKSSAVGIENNLRIESGTFRSPGGVTSIFVDGSVEIAGKGLLSGPLEIVAQGAIRVTDSVVLDNVLLFARDSIAFTGEASFSGTAMSPRRVVVNDRARLLHPSLVLVSPMPDSIGDSSGIFLRSVRPSEGACYLDCDPGLDTPNTCCLFLDTASVFTGALMSRGVADLRGVVIGTVITHSFLFTRPTTTYVNWVKGLRIDRSKLDYSPSLPIFMDSDHANGWRIARQDVLR